ncbi:hypothetical protein HanIR_Chr16g0795701 [Helianthus annuus]|nr:hypothetical protein HanIR_Chr16g0795701 [Helianthus annuus]
MIRCFFRSITEFTHCCWYLYSSSSQLCRSWNFSLSRPPYKHTAFTCCPFVPNKIFGWFIQVQLISQSISYTFNPEALFLFTLPYPNVCFFR